MGSINKSLEPLTSQSSPFSLVKPVTVPLSTLQSQSTQPIQPSLLLEAFGRDSLGIIVVSDLPASFVSLRARVLTKISHLAHLPSEKLDELTNEKAKYLVGWSHGKETLKPGVVDTFKGSYYVNSNFGFGEDDQVLQKMRQDYQGYDEYLAPNIWPEEGEGKDLAGFRRDVEELISMIVDVAGLVAQAVDRFGEEHVTGYPKLNSNQQSNGEGHYTTKAMKTPTGYLEGVVRNSRTSKARLLHYFPSDSATTSIDKNSEPNQINDTWCTTHKDHSCLTGLTSAAFYDESNPQTSYTELPASPSPSAGLYILGRKSDIYKVSIPKDGLAFQTGEALERITKGNFKAVPHFVRGVEQAEVEGHGARIARNTLAVFTQPNLGDVIDFDDGLTFGEFARGIINKGTTAT